MGSYDSAVMTGFICRLCSELNSNVVHIYSEKGLNLQLAVKINLMPISVEPQDSLPKTICYSCVDQLENQYKLIQQLKNSRDRILQHARMRLEMQQKRAAQNLDVAQSSSEATSSDTNTQPTPNESSENDNNNNSDV